MIESFSNLLTIDPTTNKHLPIAINERERTRRERTRKSACSSTRPRGKSWKSLDKSTGKKPYNTKIYSFCVKKLFYLSSNLSLSRLACSVTRELQLVKELSLYQGFRFSMRTTSALLVLTTQVFYGPLV